MPRQLTDDEIAEKLVQCFYLYNNYPVGSRGPAGLLMEVIKDLRPDVYQVIQDEDADEAWRRFFRDEEDDSV